VVLFISVLSSRLPIGGYQARELAALAPGALLPAPFAFRIWWVIYPLLLLLAGTLWFRLETWVKLLTSLTFLLQACWLVAFHFRSVELARGLLLLLVVSSVATVFMLVRTRARTRKFRLFALLPARIYTSWLFFLAAAELSVIAAERGW